jgi:hypothetical protein
MSRIIKKLILFDTLMCNRFASRQAYIYYFNEFQDILLYFMPGINECLQRMLKAFCLYPGVTVIKSIKEL